MIDKIFEMILKEARTRPGKDLSWKLFSVLTELDAMVIDAFEKLSPDFMVWLPDDPEELAKGKDDKWEEEAKKKYYGRDL